MNYKTSLDHAVTAYLGKQTMDFELLDRLIEDDTDVKSLSPMEWLQRQRDLLTINLLVRCTHSPDKYRFAVAKLLQQLQRNSLWRGFQPANAFLTLNCALAGVSHDSDSPKLTPSGSAPLDYEGQWKWARSPLQPYHAELGAIWGIYGQLFGKASYIEAARKLAEWQQHLLSYDGRPFDGFFSIHADHPYLHIPLCNALLFRVCFWTTAEQRYADIAFQQQRLAEKRHKQVEERLPAWFLFLWHWLQTKKPSFQQDSQPTQSEVICDPDNALVGHRSADFSIISTLNGGHSGVASVRTDDLELVTSGPQWLPLESPDGFGIDTTRQAEKSSVSTQGSSFSIEGRVQMSPLPREKESVACFRSGTPGGVWLNLRQDFQQHSLTIRTEFTSLPNLNELAFCYYIRASECRIESGKHLERGSLSSFKGGVCSAEFRTPTRSLRVTTFPGRGQMQVIPLPGGSFYWGSDFLLAYILDPAQFHYLWQLSFAAVREDAAASRERVSCTSTPK